MKGLYRSFATTVSQLKINDFSGETFMQRRHNCSAATSFTNSVMTLYLLEVQLQTLLFIPVTQKCQIWGCDTLVASERHKKHDLIMDIKRKRWLGHVIRMDTIKVTKKREICLFRNTRPRRLLPKFRRSLLLPSSG
jgi:hypothetical protein